MIFRVHLNHKYEIFAPNWRAQTIKLSTLVRWMMNFEMYFNRRKRISYLFLRKMYFRSLESAIELYELPPPYERWGVNFRADSNRKQIFPPIQAKDVLCSTSNLLLWIFAPVKLQKWIPVSLWHHDWDSCPYQGPNMNVCSHFNGKKWISTRMIRRNIGVSGPFQ